MHCTKTTSTSIGSVIQSLYRDTVIVC